MIEKIENIIVRTLSPFEYETLEHLSKTYTEDEIINAYKVYGNKPIGYIQKVLSSTPKKITSSWVDSEIVNQPIDKETEDVFNDFQKFLEEFRNG